MLSLATILLAASAANAQRLKQPEVVVEVERTRIDEGDTLKYCVLINNVDRTTKPALGDMADFIVEYLGETQESFTSIINNNGRIIDNSRNGRRYTYRLTPKRTGSLRIPAPKAMVDGKEFVGRSVVVTVRPAARQDLVFIDIVSDVAKVYPTQSFAVTLRLQVKALPEPYSQRDPVSFDSVVRTLTVPWADERSLPDSLKPVRKLDDWLRPLVRNDSKGFRINNFAANSGLMFFEDRALHFGLAARPMRRANADGKETDYWEYLLSRQFIATKPGNLDFGPATVRGEFVSSVIDEQARFDEVRAVSKRLSIVVKEVPTEGRPPWFTGAVGKIESHAELSPRKAKVGDPLTLTIAVKGAGIQETATPDLSGLPGVAGKFRVYEGTASTSAGARTFTYNVRPTNDGVKEFPAVPLAYFDAHSERFVTVKTPPLPVSIAPVERLAGNDIADFAPKRTLAEDAIKRPAGLRANTRNPADFVDRSVNVKIAFACVLAMIFVYAATLAGRTWLRRSHSNDAAAQRRQALAECAKLLHGAEGLIEVDPNAAASAIGQTIAHAATALTGVPNEGLTSRELGAVLAGAGVDPSAVDAAVDFLAQLETARFGAAAAIGLTTARQGMDAARRLCAIAADRPVN